MRMIVRSIKDIVKCGNNKDYLAVAKGLFLPIQDSFGMNI